MPPDTRRMRRIFFLLTTALLVAFLGSFTLGRYPISLRQLAGIVVNQVWPISPFWDSQAENILYNVRLPRILLCTLVGSCLAAAGTAYQSVFQNPLASPDVLGASAGAAFGAALAILLGRTSWGITAFAFVFGMLTVALVFLLGQASKGDPVLGLVLSGIVISSLFQAATSFIKLVADPTNQLPAITYWLMGSFAGATMKDVWFCAAIALVAATPLFLLRWRLNLLAMGDEEARALGTNPARLRMVAVLCATLLTAACVSVSGMVGWVGLVIPHFARRLAGSDNRRLLPASMLLGGLFLLLADNLSRNLLAVEIPIGILTAFAGAPFFLYLITRKGGQ